MSLILLVPSDANIAHNQSTKHRWVTSLNRPFFFNISGCMFDVFRSSLSYLHANITHTCLFSQCILSQSLVIHVFVKLFKLKKSETSYTERQFWLFILFFDLSTQLSLLSLNNYLSYKEKNLSGKNKNKVTRGCKKTCTKEISLTTK